MPAADLLRRGFVDPVVAAREAAKEAERHGKHKAFLERELAAREARDRLMPFIKFTMPDPEDPNDITRSRYQDEKHHRAIARVVEEVVKGEIQFLILSAPPRHGKSQIVSRHLPAWFAGKFPHQDVVVATYNDDFAMDFGKDVRAIVQTPQYRQVFPNFELRRGGAASNRLQTKEGGMLTFVGVGGTLTGRGASLLIIDDIISNSEQASSKTMRDKMWDWFISVAMTRRMNKKLVIITFTRWHTDDIIGRLTDPENECYNHQLAQKIKIINFPAIADEDDPLGRAPGEALWPDRYDIDFLKEQQQLNELKFAALYQQRPTVADGVYFRRENVQYYEPETLPKDLRIYAASDHAVGTTQRNDRTCLLKVGVDRQNNIYLLECDWRRMTSDAAVEAMLTMASGKDRPIFWWAERGHISKSIGPFLRKRMVETGQFINVIEVTPAADKEQRAQSIIARFAMGKVYFPKHGVWTERAIDELMSFPNGKHDDFTDTLAYVGLGLQSQFGPSSVKKTETRPKYGTLAWVKENDKWAAAKRKAAAAGGF
jgi:predicted phage terminase large subunit-like protein